MSVMEKSWEGVRSGGVVLVHVPGCNWTRTCHQWSLGTMRVYLRSSTRIPADIRLEIYRWLEQQKAEIEDEMGRVADQPPVLAERVFWLMVGLIVVSVFVSWAMLFEVAK